MARHQGKDAFFPHNLEDLLRHADAACLLKPLKSECGICLTHAIPVRIEQNIDTGHVQIQRLGNTYGKIGKALGHRERHSLPTERDIRFEAAIGGAPLHRRDRLAVDYEDADITPIARVDELLEEEVGT